MEEKTAGAGGAGGERSRPFRIGGARVRPDLNRIESARGKTVSVEPRVMDVLIRLARDAGGVVPRETLLQEVWGRTVVGEKALTRAVWSLRQALGDDPGNAAVIETIRKGGYRLIAPVEWEELGEGAGRETSVRPSRTRARAIPIVAAVLLVAAGLAGWRALLGRGGERAATPVPRTVPFTSYPGREYSPRFSPDGTRIAFAWDGPDGLDFDIYVKQKNTETPLRLTSGEANDNLPVWSADGKTVYFVRQEEDLFSILSVPAIGGDVRMHYVTARAVWHLAASPGVDELVFSERCSTGTAFRVALFSPESGAMRWLTAPPPSSRGDFHPCFSPDGRTVAFSRCDPVGFHRIHTVGTGGGEAVPAGAPRRHVQGIVFLDREELMVAAMRSGGYSLWRFTLRGGEWTGVPTQGGSIWFPDLSPDGRALVFESARYDLGIHEADLAAPEPRVSEEPVIQSTRWEDEPRFSPDGARIAFLSDRSGFPELWVCLADGSAPAQLTRMRGETLLSPCWSPDGERIAFFAAKPGGERGIYTVGLADGAPRPVLTGGLSLPSGWSADGRILYFDSDRDGEWRAWKIAEGETEPRPVDAEGASRVRETADGRFVCFGRMREPGLWRMPVVGGAEEPVLSAAEIGSVLWGNWDLAGGKVYFCDAAGIAVYDPDRPGGPRRLLEARGIMQLGLSVSPDEGRILLARLRDLEVDLMWMEGFR